MRQITLVILTDSANGYANLANVREDLAKQTVQPDQVLVMVQDDTAPLILPTDYVAIGKNSKTAQRMVSLQYCLHMPVFWDDAKRYAPDFFERLQASMQSHKSKRKTLLQRVGAFIAAVTGPKVDDAAFERRLAICKACPKLKTKGDKLFCGACGCAKWRLAELHTKLKFADLECPLDPPKWVRETPDAG